MAEDINIDNKEDNEKKKKGFLFYLWKTFRALLIFVGSFIGFILIVLIIFSALYQVQGFRVWFNGVAVDLVNGQLEGKIELADLYINPFEGVDVKGLRVLAAGDTVAYIDHAHITLDLLAILDSKALLHDVVLENPRIKLFRNAADSSWNFEHISKPSMDTTAKKMNWVFDVRNLRIKNGYVLFIDSTKTFPETDRVDFNNLFLRDLDLDLAARAEMGTGKFNADIRRLTVLEKNSGMNVKEFSLKADMDTTYANVEYIRLSTPGTNLNLKASIKKINLLGKLGDEQLKKADLYVRLHATPVSSRDLKKFFVLDAELPDTVNLLVETSGGFNDAMLGEFRMLSGKSTLILTGNAKNILGPGKLVYSAKIEKSSINHGELVKIFPAGSGNSIPEFGDLKLDNVYAEGTPEGVRADLDINSDLGGVKGWAKANWAGILQYAGSIRIREVHVDRILNNPSLSSSINGNFDFDGSGTDPKDINASVKLRSENSAFSDYAFRRVALNAYMKSGLLSVDTLMVEMNTPQSDSTRYLPDISYVNLAGRMDLNNMSIPRYEFNATLENVNVAQIARSTSAPELLSGNIKIMGEGFDPDSMSSVIDARFSDLLFHDVYLMPFDMKVSLQRQGVEARSLTLTSKFMDASLTGTYNFSNLTGLIQTQSTYLTNFISDRINSVVPETYASQTSPVVEELDRFAPLNLHLVADLKDVSPFSAFLNASVLEAQAYMDLSLDVTESMSSFKTDSFRVEKFRLEIPDDSLMIAVSPLHIYADLEMGIREMHPFLNNMEFMVKGDSDVVYNSLIIGRPFAHLDVNNDSTGIRASTSINNMADIALDGQLQFNPGFLNIILDSLNFAYMKKLAWSAIEPVDIMLNQDEINIRKFMISRENAENIAVTGRFDKQAIHDAVITVSGFPLNGINAFLPYEKQQFIESIRGRVDSLVVTINGSTESPVIDMRMNTTPIAINEISAGIISADIHHENAVVTGSLNVFSLDTLSGRNLLAVDINSLPLNMGMSGVSERLHNRVPLDAKVTGDSIPLVLASPFSVGVQNLSGYLDADISVSGNMPKDLRYMGKLDLLNAKYLLEATNINYISRGSIEVSNEQVAINELVIRNIDDDLPGGRAVVNGTIAMKEYSIEDMDINLESDGFLLLSQASARSMPTLYGNLVISTGPNPLNFSGSLKQPSLSGNINIQKADLVLAQAPGTEDIQSPVYYEYADGSPTPFSAAAASDVAQDTAVTVRQITSSPSDLDEEAKESASKPLVYDLYIKIEDRVNLTMEIGPVGELKAIIATPDPNVPVHLTPGRYGSTPIVTGGLDVVEGSSLSFILNKDFQASGSITFPTGQIDNPTLNLVAEYNGQNMKGNDIMAYTVYLKVTGTKENPKIDFEYAINGEKAVGDQSEITGDAISLLIFGQTRRDLLSGDNGSGGGLLTASDISSAYYSQLTSTFASGVSQLATAALSRTGFIQAANIEMGTGKWEEARLNLSSELPGGIKLKGGGTVADIYNNYQISVEYRIPVVVNEDWFNNILLQVSTSVGTNTSVIIREQKEWEVKIKLGGSW